MSRSKNAEFPNQTHTIGNYLFDFKEADLDEYLDMIIDHEDFSMIAYVYVSDTDTGEEIATYKRFWSEEEDVNASTGQIFVDTFLNDAKYRKNFLVHGENVEVVRPPSRELIHPKCAEAIARINNKNPKKLKFADFMNLRTYGKDKVSFMKANELEDAIPANLLADLRKSTDEEYVLKVLRWYKRGLKIEHAMRKVQTDIEISRNANSKRRA